MQHILVRWLHDFPNEPILLYSELSDERREIRKVYVFRDGPAGFASAHEQYRSVMLSLELLPSNEQIGSDPQFEVEEISRDEFERMWSDAVSQSTAGSTR